MKLRATAVVVGVSAVSLAAVGRPAARASEGFGRARENGVRSEEMFSRVRRAVNAWLRHADPRTLLLPDYLDDFRARRGMSGGPVYTPHNSGADNFPYLTAGAYLTEPSLYAGRMLEMLRNEVRFTTTSAGLPGNLDLATGALGPPSIFGGAEWAKDGAVAVSELLGRTPWFYRMADLTAAVMEQAPVASDFGKLPDAGAEVNGDLLQTLVRLATMTADPRYLEWAERIGDAYVKEVLPRNHGLPAYDWDFVKHSGPDRLRLRDHGNEIIVGLVLLTALEHDLGRERAPAYRAAVARMLERVLASANQHGMFYNEIRPSDLQPLDRGISDNWGYVYGAVYTFHMITGEPRYRDAVRRVLANLPNYRGFDWERGRQDGYADAIESTLYLIAREPVPEAVAWIESEMKHLLAYQQPDGMIEGAYPDGNWIRTVLLYALYKTAGASLAGWREGVRLGAERDGAVLRVAVDSTEPWRGKLRLDFARHRRVLNWKRNYVRLNEWPEWYAVDENTLYRVQDRSGRETDAQEPSGRERILLGSELTAGIDLAAPALLTIAPLDARSPP
jgi:hypothetical protein